jgi:hypothetical protein
MRSTPPAPAFTQKTPTHVEPHEVALVPRLHHCGCKAGICVRVGLPAVALLALVPPARGNLPVHVHDIVKHGPQRALAVAVPEGQQRGVLNKDGDAAHGLQLLAHSLLLLGRNLNGQQANPLDLHATQPAPAAAARFFHGLNLRLGGQQRLLVPGHLPRAAGGAPREQDGQLHLHQQHAVPRHCSAAAAAAAAHNAGRLLGGRARRRIALRQPKPPPHVHKAAQAHRVLHQHFHALGLHRAVPRLAQLCKELWGWCVCVCVQGVRGLGGRCCACSWKRGKGRQRTTLCVSERMT